MAQFGYLAVHKLIELNKGETGIEIGSFIWETRESSDKSKFPFSGSSQFTAVGCVESRADTFTSLPLSTGFDFSRDWMASGANGKTG